MAPCTLEIPCADFRNAAKEFHSLGCVQFAADLAASVGRKMNYWKHLAAHTEVVGPRSWALSCSTPIASSSSWSLERSGRTTGRKTEPNGPSVGITGVESKPTSKCHFAADRRAEWLLEPRIERYAEAPHRNTRGSGNLFRLLPLRRRLCGAV